MYINKTFILQGDAWLSPACYGPYIRVQQGGKNSSVIHFFGTKRIANSFRNTSANSYNKERHTDFNVDKTLIML